jgi:flagellar basal-body rod modification protein FlgD
MNGISVLTGDYSSNNVQDVSAATSKLDKDAFFRLLITQLQNQDPLNPMEDKEFISQMAQFSSLEQMQNMNTNLVQIMRIQSISECANLIGKTVETIDNNTGETIKGVVNQIAFEDNEIYVILDDDNDTKINLDGITVLY